MVLLSGLDRRYPIVRVAAGGRRAGNGAPRQSGRRHLCFVADHSHGLCIRHIDRGVQYLFRPPPPSGRGHRPVLAHLCILCVLVDVVDHGRPCSFGASVDQLLVSLEAGVSLDKTVLTSRSDGGGWGNKGLSCLVGLATPIWCFIGPDAGAHMSEELKDASLQLPRAMMWATIGNGIFGIVMLVSFW